MTTRRKSYLSQGVLVGIVISLISLCRIMTGSESAISTILWAEDGLFPLCIRNNGFVSCLLDPYGGSLHLPPRLLATIVAPVSISYWPLVANLLAGILAGTVGGMIYLILRRAEYTWPLATSLAVVPVLHHSLSQESINAYSNSYIPIAYLFVIVYLVPRVLNLFRPITLWTFTVFGILTLPSLIAVVPMAVLIGRARQVGTRKYFAIGTAVLIGVATQSIWVMRSQRNRVPGINRATIGNWAVRIPEKMVEAIIGAGSTSREILRLSTVHTWLFAGIALFLLFAICIFGVFDREPRRTAAAFVLSGLTLSAIPSVMYVPVYRYFIWFQILVVAALVFATLTSTRHPSFKLLVLVALLPSTVSGLPAKPSRVSMAYSWTSSLTAAREECRDPGQIDAEILFAPDWPTEAGIDFLTERTKNRVRCADLR